MPSHLKEADHPKEEGPLKGEDLLKEEGLKDLRRKINPKTNLRTNLRTSPKVRRKDNARRQRHR